MGTFTVKKADDLNLIIAKHLDILDGDNLPLDAVRKAESVANLIGKQLKVEGAKIAYEELRIKTGKTYGFAGEEGR
jgi:hypothetical protein